jgi:hypothetical protein
MKKLSRAEPMEAIMKRCIFLSFVGALLFSVVPKAHARGMKADAYFGYSRAGADLYSPYTPGMNGWQFAAHAKLIPFVGIEGDLSRYAADVGAGSQHSTVVMFGPRVTAGAAGLSVFAHGLAGNAHFSSTAVAFLPEISYNATSYALGGGADIPLLLSFKLRVTGDYLGNSKSPSSQYSPSHYRIGAGVAYHF